MADFIPRDLGSPLNLPEDPGNAAERDRILGEFEGFASDVPITGGIIDFAARFPPLREDGGISRSTIVRTPKLFSADYLASLGVPGVNDLPTPDRIDHSPGAIFERKGLHDQSVNVPLPDGGTFAVDMWSFESFEVPGGRELGDQTGFPAPIIRVREGEVVHTLMNNRSGPHTIHHHGIEPTPANDGVGHLTFEVSGGMYAYQWQAAEAGTYFYHCHRNTVLHFEMGMYGMLIVDPNHTGAPYPTGGPGFTLVRDALTRYDVEAIWVADDIDTRWHGVDVGDSPGPNGGILYNGEPVIRDEAAGIQAPDEDARSGFVRIGDADNPQLHRFNPNVFMVTGICAPLGSEPATLDAARVLTTQGEKLLVRTLNGAYCTTVWKFPTTLQGTVIAKDARTLGRSGTGSYSQPFTLIDIGHEFTFTTAQRWDILIDTGSARTGDHFVEIEFRHWITNALLRTLRVPINVGAAG